MQDALGICLSLLGFLKAYVMEMYGLLVFILVVKLKRLSNC